MLKSIKSRMLFLIVALMTVTMLAVVFTTKQNFEMEMEDLYEKLLRDALQSAMYMVEHEYDHLISHESESVLRHRERMKHVSSSVLSVINGNCELRTSGILSEDEAKRRSLNWISRFRYGADQYFFVCDTALIGLSHPLKDMIGKKWTGFEDIRQKDALPLMREILQGKNGAYAVFQWPGLSDRTQVRQMGYFTYYPEWEWIIGTSIRTDDIRKDSCTDMGHVVKTLEDIFSVNFSESVPVFIFDGNGKLIVCPKTAGKKLLDTPLDEAIVRRLKAGARNPGKPVEHPCFFSEKSEHTHPCFSYVDYFKAADWYVAVSASDQAISDPVRNLITRQTYTIMAILLAGIAITILLSRKMEKPLLNLARYAKDIPGKDFATEDFQPLPNCCDNAAQEIRDLFDAFLCMENRLRENIRALSWESDINSVFAELSEALIQARPLDDISYLVLEHAKRVTGSAYGYVGYIDPHTGNLIAPTLTKDIWNECGIPDKDIVFEKFTGLWGWVVKNRKPLLANSSSDDPGSSGIPEGHVPIHRFLSVPALIGDGVVGQISLANPERDFTDRDMRLAERLATVYALAIRRGNMEEALREAHDGLEERVKERTVELGRTNEQLKREIEIRRNAEKSLRESEALYRTLIETIPYGITELDTSGVIIFANSSYHKLLGYDEGELIGKSILEVIPPDSERETMKNYIRTLVKEQPEPAPWIGKDLTKEKKVIEVQVDWNYKRDEQGRVTGFVSAVTDITERERAKRLMRIQRNLGIALSCSSGLTDALNWIMDAVLQVDGMDCVGIYLVDSITGGLDLITHIGLSPDFVKSVFHYDADSPNTRLIMEGKSIYRGYPETVLSEQEDLQYENLRCLAIVPVQYRGKVVASLNLASHTCKEVLTGTRNAIETIASQIGPVIARVKTEDALRESEEKFRRQFRGIPIPTFVWRRQNDDFVLADYNEAAESMTHGKIQNALGVKATDWCSRDNPDVLLDMDACFREKKTVRKQHYYTLRTTGERKFLSACYVFIPPDTVMAHAIDLTALKEMEVDLRQALSELRAIFDTTPGLTIVVDTEHNILNMNNRYLDEFRLSENENFIGRKCYEIFERTSICPTCIIARVFESGHPKTRFSTPDEEEITGKAWKFYAAPLKDDSGKITGAVEIIMDTTDLKEMSEELIKTKEAAESANRAKSEFLANMSHELRTPLNGILGYAQILRRDGSLTENHKRQIGIMHSSGEHLLQLINDVLDLAKIEARKVELNPVRFHFPSFLKTIVNMIRIQAHQRGIAFEYKPSPDLPAGVNMDDKRLRQILLNLLGNALKFTEQGKVVFSCQLTVDSCQLTVDGGQLTVDSCQLTVDGGQLTVDSCQLTVDGDHLPVDGDHLPVDGDSSSVETDSQPSTVNRQPSTVNRQLPTANRQPPTANRQPSTVNRQLTIRFQVEDTGIGIPDENLEEIFLPFHQLGDRRIQTEGTGQGLAISQRLVSMMGSELHVKSVKGQGSTFWFSLDMPESAWDAETIEKQNMIGYKGERRRILITDDVKMNRMVMENLLSPLGFEVLEAVDGPDALNKAADFQPDLILMDLVMPKMDGFETARQIREIPGLSEVVVIAVSARTSKGIREKCLAAGCDDYVAKPVYLDELLEMIKTFLELDWIYEEECDKSETETEPMVPPPKEDIAGLLKSAMIGDAEAIMEQADAIGASDPKYAPFAKKVRQMAKELRIMKIKKFLSSLES
ncbi:GAF domain-containing protein [Desulfobacterales bacterium HSG2]|nr:GAF domain-containing protein [Desulfobacterales bacterium HSG2]